MRIPNTIRPKLAPMPVFCAIFGESRSGAYRKLAAGILRGVKNGRTLLLDVEHAEPHYAALPEATFRKQEAA